MAFDKRVIGLIIIVGFIAGLIGAFIRIYYMEFNSLYTTILPLTT